MKDEKNAQQPQKRPTVYPGDEIYLKHSKGPYVGKVLAHGEHGCTVQIGKGTYKVGWDHVMGHKSRAEARVKLHAHGEDGMVISDASGRRRFIGVQPAEAPERIMVRDVVAKPAGQPATAPKKPTQKR